MLNCVSLLQLCYPEEAGPRAWALCCSGANVILSFAVWASEYSLTPYNCRYLKLLQSGAHEAKLDQEYTAWLDSMACVPNKERGDKYYTAPDGSRVKVPDSLFLHFPSCAKSPKGQLAIYYTAMLARACRYIMCTIVLHKASLR